MTFYPIILTYLESKDFSYVEAYQEELRGFYGIIRFMYHMDLYLDRDFIPLLEDNEAIIHYSNLVENKQTALDKHIANLVNLKIKFFEDSILKSTPDMPYSMYIDMDYNNAKIISKK